MMKPYVLRGGLIADGSGGEPFVGDVEILDGRIGRVGRLGRVDDAVEMDVAGLVVAPGFIDIHTHYDAQIVWDDLLQASTQYGMTTLVMGNCGIGVAPFNDNS